MNKVGLKFFTENGDKVEVAPSSFVPLNFYDLFPNDDVFNLQAKVNKGDGRINDEIIEQENIINIPIKFNYSLSVYTIVNNGWLPIIFRNSKWLIPDRNLISAIIQIESNNLKNNNKSIKWWLDFIKQPDIMINPLLYAIEGNKRRQPSYSEFCQAFDKAIKKLCNYFPREKVISYKSEKFYRAGYAILQETTAKQRDEVNFLIETVPLVLTPHPEKKLAEKQTKIDEISMKYNVFGNSFVYFLIISCLYERNDKKFFKTARKVLKPKKNYNEIDAYNTISDINILNLFIQSCSAFDEPFSICTCDKGLVAFWSGLNPIAMSNKNKKIKIEFTLNECLFPRLDVEQRYQLAENIRDKMNK